MWNGGNVDLSYTNSANWSGGTVPPNTGADTMVLSGTHPGNIIVNTPANVAGIVEYGTGFPEYNFSQASGGTLTIGAGGIAPNASGSLGTLIYFNLPVVLSANQTWTTATPYYIGFVFSSAGISGTPGLTIGDGNVYIFGTNTYSGGLTVSSTGQLLAGSTSAAGTGTLTLDSGASISNATGATLAIANPVSVGSSVNVGTQNSPQAQLNFTGTLTAQAAATSIYVEQGASVYISGTFTGPSGEALTITSNDTYGSLLPADGGSQLIFTGTLATPVGSLTVNNASLVLAPTGSPSAQIAGVNALTVTGSGYLGLDGTYSTTAGSVTALVNALGTSDGANFSGTIGFDNVTGTGSGVFNDPVSEAAFSSGGFLGLGSSSAATLSSTALITPVTATNQYVFGGGGGTLTVQSTLADYDGTGLVMTSAPAPLTLILQGANNYLGGTTVDGGVLVFDSLPPPSGTITVNGGYVGYTQNADISLGQTWVANVASGANGGVIGFDTASGQTEVTISDAIDLTANGRMYNVFLGTSTSATISGTINPLNNTYQFTGVKGGALTVSSNLTNSDSSLVLGLPNPIEINQATSSVTLTGSNAAVASATLNSGAIFINNGSALGSGNISVPDTATTTIAPYLASYGGNTVTLANPITIASITVNGAVGPGLTVGNGSPSTGDDLVLNGVISDGATPGVLGIAGPVTLGAANTYSGGTYFTGVYGAAEAFVTNSSSFGTGPITLNEAGQISPVGGPVVLSNAITVNGELTLGSFANPYLLTLNGLITGNNTLNILSNVALNGANTGFAGPVYASNATVTVGNSSALGTGALYLSQSSVDYAFSNPTLTDLSGDGGSTIALATGSTLTLNADTNAGEYSYYGVITGDASSTVVKTGPGVQLVGSGSLASTYGGGTNVTAGTLIAGSNGALGTNSVTVASGASLGVDSGVTLSNTLTLANGAGLVGRGTFSSAGPLTISNGVQVTAGNPVQGQMISTLTFSTPQLTLGPGGILNLNVATASGVAGIDYSTVSATGAVAITATSGSPFALNLLSVNPDSGSSGAAVFSSLQPYSWTFLSGTSISGFNASDFSINIAGFQNSTAGGLFSVTQSGNSLLLNFTPVPEPSTWVLMVGGVAGLGLGLLVHRRRQAVA